MRRGAGARRRDAPVDVRAHVVEEDARVERRGVRRVRVGIGVAVGVLAEQQHAAHLRGVRGAAVRERRERRRGGADRALVLRVDRARALHERGGVELALDVRVHARAELRGQREHERRGVRDRLRERGELRAALEELAVGLFGELWEAARCWAAPPKAEGVAMHTFARSPG